MAEFHGERESWEARNAALRDEFETERETWQQRVAAIMGEFRGEREAWEARLAAVQDEHRFDREKLQARVAHGQAELHDARQNAVKLEMRVAEAQERARHAERLTDDIRYSTVWRLSAPARALVEKIPVLHVSLKRCRALARIIIHGR